jgi:hypothetical protein
MWHRITGWFHANAEHVTVEFLPDPESAPLAAHEGYLRLWLSEGFVAQARNWGARQFPALHGGASLSFLGSERTPFTTFTRPPGAWQVPGAQLDFPITPLLPWGGGIVEVEAALYEASTESPLGTALDLLGGLVSLIGPPLATAATIAGKVSEGLDTVLAASGAQPILGVHLSMVAPGGVGNVLRAGHLAVIGTPRDSLEGALSISDGRLRRDGAQLSGVDYLVLRVECRTERDDWRFPELDRLVLTAGEAYIHGRHEVFKACRTEAIVAAWNSADLTPNDRKRVAKFVAEEIDAVAELGAVPGPRRALEFAAAERLPGADAIELRDLRLGDLLVSSTR